MARNSNGELYLSARRYNQCMAPAHQLAEADFPTRWGHFRIRGFELGAESGVALVMGDLNAAPPLVRIHSQCLTGDVFGSLRRECRQQMDMARAMLASAR